MLAERLPQSRWLSQGSRTTGSSHNPLWRVHPCLERTMDYASGTAT